MDTIEIESLMQVLYSMMVSLKMLILSSKIVPKALFVGMMK